MSDEVSNVIADMIKVFISLAILVVAVMFLYKDPFIM